MLEIEVRAQSAAAATTVWAILTHVTTWTVWSPVDRAQVESGHELGEVRRFRVPLVASLSWPWLTSRERTTISELPHRWGFEMLSGVPGGRDYAAEVNLIPTPAGGTDIRWRVSLRPSVTGTGERCGGCSSASMPTPPRDSPGRPKRIPAGSLLTGNARAPGTALRDRRNAFTYYG
jgi:Polyketide cyclase / dehydrase and lipid transport